MIGSDISEQYVCKRHTIVIITIYGYTQIKLSRSNRMYAALQITLLQARSQCSVISHHTTVWHCDIMH